MDKLNIEKEIEYINKVNNIIKFKEYKYYIFTFGCQQNVSDSEKIAGMLEEMGYKKCDNPEDADIIIFNTCCVRENAEERLFGKIGEFKKQKELKGTILAIGGCMMQEKDIPSKIKQSYPQIDIIFGTHTLQNLAKDIYSILVNKIRIEDIEYIDGDIIEGLPIKREDNIKGSISIMYGCNNFCTYCIVPYVRGRERSRNPLDIIEEAQNLAKTGYKEIMLLGQNVNSYLRSERERNINLNYTANIDGKVLNVNSFATLLIALNEIKGIEKIRFISPHPKDFTDDVIEAIKNCDKVSKLIHLPLQSGSTKILKAMNRNYTKEQYLELVDKIKSKIENVTFSTDIIVGFPGETEGDFKDTLEVVDKVGYDQVFMFIYSIRRGTPAEKMIDQIPEEIKHERFNRLKELADSKVEIINNKYINTIQNILVEGYSKTDKSYLTGRTDSNKVVIFKGEEDLIGNFIDIKITDNHIWYLEGEKI